MSTRAHIAKVMDDRSVHAIYVHHDGYVDDVGNTLYYHYQDPNKINTLISLGDLSSLGIELGEKHDFHSSNDQVCTAYGHDRDETRTEAKEYRSLNYYLKSIAQDTYIEYIYIFNEGEWYYRKNTSANGHLKLLADYFNK